MDTLNNTIIPAFEKLHPDVKVEAQALPYDDLRTKILTSVAGGEAPDLIRADIIWVPEFAELGALAPLDTEMSDFAMLKEQVYAGPLETNFYDGHYYGLPLDTNTRIMFYSDELMSAAGVTEAPKTFDDFKALCDKVKALGKADTYCYAEGGTGAWSLLPWVWSNGGDITNADYTKATGFLNGPATVEAITMLRDMLKDGTLSPGILGNGIATSDAIGKGQSATILDGPWMPSIFEKQFPDLKLTTAAMPAGPGGSASVVGGEDVVLLESSQNKEAATAFMKYLLSEDAQIAMGKVGQMPVLKSLNGNSELPAYYSTFQTQLLTAKARTPNPNWQKIDDAFNTAALSVMRGEKEPQAALDEAATVVDALLADK
jgi:multiple sugar transport system substrate-binding protein